MKLLEKELFTIYLLVDLFILNTCFTVFHLYRLDASNGIFHQHLICFLHFNVCWVIVYCAFAKKTLYLHKGFSDRIYRMTKRVLLFTVLAFATAFSFMSGHLTSNIAEFSLFFYLGLLCAYFIIFKYLKYKREFGLNTVHTAIISNCEKGYLLRRIIAGNPILGSRFLGFIVRDNSMNQRKVPGSARNLDELITEHQNKMIFSVQDAANQKFNQKLAAKCDKYGVRLRLIVRHKNRYKFQPGFETLSGIELGKPQKIPLDDTRAKISKRLFDIVFSSVIILGVFTWLFPFVALIIKLTSRGPVFFVQKRTGINNKTFNCIKFRSMKLNILSDIKQATVNDVRITPIGQFLRSSHIDELPQFFNVLWGQMSVIGPRPHMLKHTEQYSELIEHYLMRHYVKPGITGWAQINGYCGETEELWKMEKRVECDLFYVFNWTFYLDIKIIWRTVFNLNTSEMQSTKPDFRPYFTSKTQKSGKVQNLTECIFSEIS